MKLDIQKLVAQLDYITILRDGSEKLIFRKGELYDGYLVESNSIYNQKDWIIIHSDRIKRRYTYNCFTTINKSRDRKLNELRI